MSTRTMDILWRPTELALGYLPEGPIECFDGRISWVAIQHGSDEVAGSLNLLEPASGVNQSIALPGRPGFAFPTDEPNVFLAGVERQIVSVDVETGHCEVLSDEVDAGVENTIINDGIEVEEGLIFGCKDLEFQQRKAGLYFWRKFDGALFQLRDDQLCSNGKVVERDGNGWLLWDIDSPTRTVVRYRLDLDACALSEPELILDLTHLEMFPDGMTLAAGGEGVVIAFYNPNDVEAGEVHQYSLLSGEHQATWLVPGSPQVTCPLIWDSPEGERLVVTTAAENMSPEKRSRYPAAGAMFVGELPPVEAW